jgi:hypothetical protein
MDLENWQDPTLNIAYSRGGRMGQSLSETSVNIGMVLVEAADMGETKEHRVRNSSRLSMFDSAGFIRRSARHLPTLIY